MNNTFQNYRRLLRNAILCAAALFPPAACVSEEGECPADTSKKDIAVSLVIKGNLPAAGSRADLPEQDGTVSESYIDIKDLYILSFGIDGGKEVADGSSVLKDIIWSPEELERLKESTVSSNGTNVFIRTFLSSESYNTTEPFALVAVANIKNWNGGSYTLKTGKTTLGELQKTLSYPSTTEGTAATAWMPDNAKSDGIPLFGIQRCSLSGYDQKYNNGANPFPLGTTWLLRALAKIELTTAAGSGLEIESAQVIANSWNSTLQLIPFQSYGSLSRMEKYTETGNTGQVNLSPDFSAFSPTPSSKALNFSPATVKREDGTTTTGFVAYLPEYQLVSAIAGEDPRNDIVRIRFKGQDTKEFSLAIRPYDKTTGQPIEGGGEEIYWKYLLRNHLYRFQITGIQEDQQEATLSIKYTVCPMEPYTTDIPDFN